MRYNEALECGLFPSEFWNMSLKEVKDTVRSRIKQRQTEIYALSSMVRVAVLSCFSENNPFPPPPSFDDEENVGDWTNSYNYLAALSAIHKPKGGTNK